MRFSAQSKHEQNADKAQGGHRHLLVGHAEAPGIFTALLGRRFLDLQWGRPDRWQCTVDPEFTQAVATVALGITQLDIAGVRTQPCCRRRRMPGLGCGTVKTFR